MRVGVELDLRGKVAAGVALLPHRQWGHLRVAQVELLVGIEDSVREMLLVLTGRPDVLALLGADDCGAGVLAHRQDAAS